MKIREEKKKKQKINNTFLAVESKVFLYQGMRARLHTFLLALKTTR